MSGAFGAAKAASGSKNAFSSMTASPLAEGVTEHRRIVALSQLLAMKSLHRRTPHATSTKGHGKGR